MIRIASRTLFTGLAAGFLVMSFAQGAKADTCVIYRAYESMPTTTYVESPYTVERVISSPVVIERPAATVERVIEKPVVIREKRWEPDHLLHLRLFPLLNFNVL